MVVAGAFAEQYSTLSTSGQQSDRLVSVPFLKTVVYFLNYFNFSRFRRRSDVKLRARWLGWFESPRSDWHERGRPAHVGTFAGKGPVFVRPPYSVRVRLSNVEAFVKRSRCDDFYPTERFEIE